MRLRHILAVFSALIAGTIGAALAAVLAASIIESRSQADVSRVLGLNGYDWVQVDVEGLQVILSGFAADEATRFRALSVAGTVVDASRVIDMMNVIAGEAVQPPRFSIEILRNDDGISLIGLIPASMDRQSIIAAIQDIAGGADVTDLLDVAEFAPPEGWSAAVKYGLSALSSLPRSKISIAADGVDLRAISDSVQDKRSLETELARTAPQGLPVSIDISAPRPVITPYTLRFLIDNDGARFDACSTDTVDGRDAILSAARAAGLQGKATCTIGLGVPSPKWDAAVTTAIAMLSDLGGGSVTFSDADVTLVALESTPQSIFDRVVGELQAALPEVFSLHAILPEPVKIDRTGQGDGPPEFVATRSPEGHVRLRGRVANERARTATESFAQARFGSAVVDGTMRLDDALPRGWSTRVLASLDALALLNSGSVVTQPDFVEIRGITGNRDARAEIARILSEKLGESENYRISVTYEEKLDPLANIPTQDECVQQINQVLAARKITFAPSSANIDDSARETIDGIAKVMKGCIDVAMEIGGHTDSQGREIMNLSLSQARAETVVNALLARRVLTSNLVAKGFGESQPIADNETEDGREANRRIEFTLILPEEKGATEVADDDATELAPQTTEAESPDEQN